MHRSYTEVTLEPHYATVASNEDTIWILMPNFGSYVKVRNAAVPTFIG